MRRAPAGRTAALRRAGGGGCRLRLRDGFRDPFPMDAVRGSAEHAGARCMTRPAPGDSRFSHALQGHAPARRRPSLTGIIAFRPSRVGAERPSQRVPDSKPIAPDPGKGDRQAAASDQCMTLAYALACGGRGEPANPAPAPRADPAPPGVRVAARAAGVRMAARAAGACASPTVAASDLAARNASVTLRATAAGGDAPPAQPIDRKGEPTRIQSCTSFR